MNNDIFIKVSLDAAIKKYLLFRNKKDASLASDFLVYVICMLIYIYSETDILNPYINRQNNGEDGFRNNLGKFGLQPAKINKFLNDLEGYYETDHYNKVNRLTKNEFFSYLQEDIIDMFLAKASSTNLDCAKYKEFENLLFSPNTTNEIRRKINEYVAVDSWAVINYYKECLYKKEHEVSFKQVKNNLLSYDVYNVFGITKDNLEVINQETLDEINRSIYGYFNINPISFNAKSRLAKEVEALKAPKFRLSSQSGKTNILIFLVIFSATIIVGIVLGVIIMGRL